MGLLIVIRICDGKTISLPMNRKISQKKKQNWTRFLWSFVVPSSFHFSFFFLILRKLFTIIYFSSLSVFLRRLRRLRRRSLVTNLIISRSLKPSDWQDQELFLSSSLPLPHQRSLPPLLKNEETILGSGATVAVCAPGECMRNRISYEEREINLNLFQSP